MQIIKNTNSHTRFLRGSKISFLTYSSGFNLVVFKVWFSKLQINSLDRIRVEHGRFSVKLIFITKLFVHG